MAHAEIDLAAVRKNLAAVRMMCPASRILAVVKADAYGHGLLPVARSLQEADGLAVARFQEALLLREAGIRKRVVLFGTLLKEEEVAQCAQLDIDVTVHDRISLQLAVAQSRKAPLRVWLKLDSGMHRVGFDPDAFIIADRVLSLHRGILEVVHMTHLCDVEHAETTDRQLRCFWDCHQAASRAETSIANSGAIILRPETHSGWIRPGIMLYGETPLHEVKSRELKVVMELKAPIIAIREIECGQYIGYNRRWKSERPSLIGTVGIGYADGYPRHAINGTPVCIGEKRVSLVGQVSMDSIMIDLTDCREVCVGDMATLWGACLSPSIIAKHANTIPYELVTRIAPRVRRIYRN